MIRAYLPLGVALLSTSLLLMPSLTHPGVLEAAPSSASPEQEEAQKGDKKLPKFVGLKECKLCHTRKSVGAQTKLWQSSLHAKAWETLGTDKAKEIAKTMGIEDPQKSDKCLECHVTGHGLDKERFAESYSVKEGVQCEACHGPGEFYFPEDKHTKDATAHAIAELGLVVQPTEKMCRECHNERSPTYKEFDFKEFSKKIAHPIPEEEKK